MSIEQEGGASQEERAEAEKFNEMVSEGKLTTAEVAQVEKEKTPDSSPEQKSREKIEAEKAAMEKIIDCGSRSWLLHWGPIEEFQTIVQEGLRSSLHHGKKDSYGITPVNTVPFVDGAHFRKFVNLGGRGGKNGEVGYLIAREGVPLKAEKYRLGFSHREAVNVQREIIAADQFIGLVLEGNIFYVPDRERQRALLSDKGLSRGEIDQRIEENTDRVRKRPFELLRQISQPAADLRVPVYDREGNVLFPRIMPHNKVQQFLAEREARKKAQEGEQSNASTG